MEHVNNILGAMLKVNDVDPPHWNILYMKKERCHVIAHILKHVEVLPVICITLLVLFSITVVCKFAYSISCF